LQRINLLRRLLSPFRNFSMSQQPERYPPLPENVPEYPKVAPVHVEGTVTDYHAKDVQRAHPVDLEAPAADGPHGSPAAGAQTVYPYPPGGYDVEKPANGYTVR
jgi:hypothetical protein